MESKLYIAQYAGITVMLPAALVVAAWLLYASSKKIAALWLGVLFCAYFIVALSKLLFKGWGVGIEQLNIAVISGHATNVCLVFTVAFNLLVRQFDKSLRWYSLGVGTLASWWFSIEYIAPAVHPLPEAIAGALVGTPAACYFLLELEKVNLRKLNFLTLSSGILIVLLASSIPKYTAESLLNNIAMSLSGAPKAFEQPAWRTD